MHLFIPIVAAGITLYLLRNWWERLQYRREGLRIQRMLYPQSPSELRPAILAGGALAALFILALALGPH